MQHLLHRVHPVQKPRLHHLHRRRHRYLHRLLRCRYHRRTYHHRTYLLRLYLLRLYLLRLYLLRTYLLRLYLLRLCHPVHKHRHHRCHRLYRHYRRYCHPVHRYYPLHRLYRHCCQDRTARHCRLCLSIRNRPFQIQQYHYLYSLHRCLSVHHPGCLHHRRFQESFNCLQLLLLMVYSWHRRKGICAVPVRLIQDLSLR